MNTNLFIEFKFYENVEDNITKKYIIQYKLDGFKEYKKYQNKFQKEHSIKFKNKFLATRSLFIKIL